MNLSRTEPSASSGVTRCMLRRPDRSSSRSGRAAVAAERTSAAAVDSGGRNRWLARGPLPAVAHAARTNEWKPLIHLSLEQAQQAAQEQAAAADDLGLTMDGRRMLDWLTSAVQAEMYRWWDLDSSHIVAGAYDRLLAVQGQGLRSSGGPIERIARRLRDVIVMAAIDHAGSHSDRDSFLRACSDMFRRQLDEGLGAQLEHTYHQALHGVPSEFQSQAASKRSGKPRKQRKPRQQLRDVAEDGDEGEGEGEGRRMFCCVRSGGRR